MVLFMTLQLLKTNLKNTQHGAVYLPATNYHVSPRLGLRLWMEQKTSEISLSCLEKSSKNIPEMML